MSLLLKALQNAAKNREAGGAERSSEPALEGGARATAPAELSLEPVQPTPRGSARAESAGGDQAGERHAPSGPQYAQSVLRAGAGARTQRLPRHEPGILDWLARRPLVAFSTAAGLFAIGYGIYLYLQLTNPGIFIAKPQPPRPSIAAAPPPPQPAAPRPPASAPAPTPPSPSSAAPTPASGPSATSLTGATPPQPPARAEVGTPGTAASVATPPASTSPARGPVPTPPQPSTAPVTTAAADPATPARAAPERPSAPPAMAARAPRRSEPASAAATIAPSAPAAAGGAKMAAIETGTVPPAARPSAPRGRPKAPAAAAAPELQDGVTTTGASQVVAVDRVVQEAYQALAQGRVNEAERLYRQSLASDARNVDAMLGLAAALAQKHQGEAASQLYMRVLEQDPRNTFAQAGLLNVAGHADPVAAEARLKQLIAIEPSAFLYFTLGNLYAGRGQWAAAQGAYFQAHKLDPDNPDYAFNLAVGLEHLSQPKIALDYYRRAVTLAQARGSAQFELARVENRIRSLESALAAAP